MRRCVHVWPDQTSKKEFEETYLIHCVLISTETSRGQWFGELPFLSLSCWKRSTSNGHVHQHSSVRVSRLHLSGEVRVLPCAHRRRFQSWNETQWEYECSSLEEKKKRQSRQTGLSWVECEHLTTRIDSQLLLEVFFFSILQECGSAGTAECDSLSIILSAEVVFLDVFYACTSTPFNKSTSLVKKRTKKMLLVGGLYAFVSMCGYIRILVYSMSWIHRKDQHRKWNRRGRSTFLHCYRVLKYVSRHW